MRDINLTNIHYMCMNTSGHLLVTTRDNTTYVYYQSDLKELVGTKIYKVLDRIYKHKISKMDAINMRYITNISFSARGVMHLEVEHSKVYTF